MLYEWTHRAVTHSQCAFLRECTEPRVQSTSSHYKFQVPSVDEQDVSDLLEGDARQSGLDVIPNREVELTRMMQPDLERDILQR